MSMFRSSAPPAVERMVLVCSILILTLAAWVALWLTEDSVNSFFSCPQFRSSCSLIELVHPVVRFRLDSYDSGYDAAH